MRIHIDGLEIYCIIGLLESEREMEQKVLLDLEMQYTYCEDTFLDYSKVVAHLTQHLKNEKYLLLEEALAGIKRLLFEQFPATEQLKVKLSKPDILPHCSVGLSEVWVNIPQQQ